MNMFIQKEIKSILASLAVALIVAIVSLTYNTIKDLKTSVDSIKNSNDMRDVIQDNKLDQFQSNVMDHFHEIDSNINIMHSEFDKVKFLFFQRGQYLDYYKSNDKIYETVYKKTFKQ